METEARGTLDSHRATHQSDWHGETFLDHLITNVCAGVWYSRHSNLRMIHTRTQVEGATAVLPPTARSSNHTVLPPAATAGAAVTSTSSLIHTSRHSTIPSRVRGKAGGQGMGTWQHGRTGAPVIVRVPLGTVVHELPHGDRRRT